MEQQLNEFADKFLQAFYGLPESNQGLFGSIEGEQRGSLAMFYRENSMLTFEERKFNGTVAIIEKYCQLPPMRWQQASRDVQPSLPDGSVLISIIGQILYEGTDHPQTFIHVFHLVPEGGQWYILNDIFRFAYV